MRHVALIISATVPSEGDPDYAQQGMAWLDTVGRAVKELRGAGWDVITALDNPEALAAAIAAHSASPAAHPALGDVAFSGRVDLNGEVYSAGDKGFTGSRKIGGHTLTFKNGLLTGVDPAGR